MHSIKSVERAMRLYEIIGKAMQGEITWYEAAEVLGLSERQLRRMRKRCATEGGVNCLFDQRRGPAKSRIAEDIREKVLSLYRDEYFDFNTKHFHEKLQSEHGITQSYVWVRNLLLEAKLICKQLKRDPHRSRRERRPLEGILLHLDGSDHTWLGEGRPRWDLLATLDDATNEVYQSFFVPEEDTRSILKILQQTVQKKRNLLLPLHRSCKSLGVYA